MKILVTGAGGFLGKNLVASLQMEKYEAVPYCHSDGIERLREVCQNADYVFHLAGVNRRQNEVFTKAMWRLLRP